MAYDKVIDSAKLDRALEATANALRAITNSTDEIIFDLENETGFSEAITNLPAGGGGDKVLIYDNSDNPVVITKAVTQGDFGHMTELLSSQNTYEVEVAGIKMAPTDIGDTDTVKKMQVTFTDLGSDSIMWLFCNNAEDLTNVRVIQCHSSVVSYFNGEPVTIKIWRVLV